MEGSEELGLRGGRGLGEETGNCCFGGEGGFFLAEGGAGEGEGFGEGGLFGSDGGSGCDGVGRFGGEAHDACGGFCTTELTKQKHNLLDNSG